MKVLLMVVVASLAFAGTESRVSTASLALVEKSINQRFATGSTDASDIIVDARGTYLEGYGAVFTNEINLVNSSLFTPNPFVHPKIEPQDIVQVHDRKLKKLPILKETMRTLLLDASSTLDGMPLNEKVALEVKLFSFSWEDNKGLPRRVLMTAEKQKLLAAKANHADLTTIIDEQER